MEVFAAIFVDELCLFLDYSGVCDHHSFFGLRLCVILWTDPAFTFWITLWPPTLRPWAYKRRSECEAWSEEAMIKYVKYRKFLDSKSKAKKEKKTSSSNQASLSTSRDSSVGFTSAASAGVWEARVTELISAQLGELNSSFAVSF